MNPKVELEKAFQVIQAPAPDSNLYLDSVKILSSLVTAKKEEKVLSQESIMGSIDKATEDIKKGLNSSLQEVLAKLTSYRNKVED